MSTPAYSKNELQPIQLRHDGKIVPIKIGGFGVNKSGKSYTSALLSVAISALLHDHAPVYVYDSEPGWQFVQEIFDAEGVPLIQEAGQTFDGLMAAREKAEKAGACVFVGDSYTHFWQDLMKGFMGKGGYVEFPDWNEIKTGWREWVTAYMNSPMHCIALARQGWNYQQEPDEERKGKYKIIKTDSKFNAGGGESFGYEPHLLMEFEVLRRNAVRGHGGVLSRQVTILGDRLQVLDGRQFTFATRPYRKGDCAEVWNALAPHVQKMQTIKNHVLLPPTSMRGSAREYFQDTEYSKSRQQREEFLEVIENTLVMLWPSTSQEAKRNKLMVLETIFKVRSWEAIKVKPLDELEYGVEVLRVFEKKIKGEVPEQDAKLLQQLEASRDHAQAQRKQMELQPF